MSCPVLSIHILSKASPNDVTDFLCSSDAIEPYKGVSRRHVANVGAVAVSLDSSHIFEGSYGGDWDFVIVLDCPYTWWELRFLLALELCNYLYSKSKGKFLASYDTGSVAFYIDGKDFIVPEHSKPDFCKYPNPFFEPKFQSLPTV